MKYIIVPAPVDVRTIDGKDFVVVNGPSGNVKVELEKGASFQDFVMTRLIDAKFTSGMGVILQALKIRDAVHESKKTGVLMLEDADYAILKSAVESPSALPNGQNAYQNGLAHNLAPFMRAIVDEATDKKPDIEPPKVSVNEGVTPTN